MVLLTAAKLWVADFVTRQRERSVFRVYSSGSRSPDGVINTPIFR